MGNTKDRTHEVLPATINQMPDPADEGECVPRKKGRTITEPAFFLGRRTLHQINGFMYED